MLIGAIENVTADRVSGWIHSPLADLQGELVLAFVDGGCVGSGRVGLFRQDLADAGLLHGRLGFDFGITLRRRGDAGRLVVSLDRCEAVILQRGSRVAAAAAEDGRGSLLPAELPGRETAAWLLRERAISDAEFAFLEGLQEFGVAAWALEPPGRQDVAAPEVAAPGVAARQAAARLFGLCALRRLGVARLEVPEAGLLDEMLASGDAPSRAGVLAYHSERPVSLRLIEGSHREAEPDLIAQGPAGEIEYAVQPGHLLVVHRRCRHRMLPFGKGRQVTLYVPEEPVEAAAVTHEAA